MSVLLQRGGNVSLNPQAQRVAVAIGWDASPSKHGASRSRTQIDLDTSAFMLGQNGQVLSDEHFIFFNQPTSPDGGVRHLGNNTTGLGGGDDEVIDLSQGQTLYEAYTGPKSKLIVEGGRHTNLWGLGGREFVFEALSH